MNQKYEDWDEVIEKLESEIINADKALLNISIAKESQEYLLKYAKEKIKQFPKPKAKGPDKSKHLNKP